MANRKVNIIIPAKNEEESIGLLLADLTKVLSKMATYDFEVIVVDDHSKDRTGAIARAMNVTVVRNNGAAGKGMSLRKGFEAANGDILVMMDADYSHRPEDLPFFLQEVERGAGMVIGSRIYGGSDEFMRSRALGNIILTWIFSVFHHCDLTDALNGYKAFRSDVFTDFTYTSREFEIEVELLVNALRKGYKIVEVISHERARHGGRAKSFVIRHGTRFLWRILYEWFRLSRR
jgi:glycosyltransferase involved in cell wall biosynthesis